MTGADADVLQKRETTPTVTKRRCGGTTAKLMICVGMKTPLQPALQRQHRAYTDEDRERRTSCG